MSELAKEPTHAAARSTLSTQTSELTAAGTTQLPIQSSTIAADESSDAAPTINDIEAAHNRLGKAEWADYVAALIGKWYRNQAGWVNDYDRRWLSDKYFLQLALEAPGTMFGAWDVQFEIPKPEDRKHRIGDEVIFSGRILAVNCGGKCTLDLQDVTYDQQNQAAAPATAIPAQPTAVLESTPLPTLTPDEIAALGPNDTAQLGGWVFSLGRVETRSILIEGQSAPLAANERWWIVWLDARNNQDDARPLTWDLIFQLKASTGSLVNELDTLDRPGAAQLARAEQRDAFTAVIAPGGVAHTILAFRLPGDTRPAYLLAQSAIEPHPRIAYDLSAAAGPALERAATAAAQATSVAVARSTEVAHNAAATAQVEQAAATAVAATTATAVARADAQATAAAAVPKAEITYIYYDGQQYRTEGDEYAEISNTGGAPLNLKGYRLNAGDPGQDFYFPARVLQPGESLRVFTNAYGDPGDYSFDIGRAIWNNAGDCGYLYNARGQQVDSYCY